MIRSLAEVISSKQPIFGLILRSSKDLTCTNLFCERVTEPCVCRLDKVLNMKKLTDLKQLDLSSNGLFALPPSLSALEQLEELDLSHNNLSEIPSFLLSLPNLKVLNIAGNIGIKMSQQAPDSKLQIIYSSSSKDVTRGST